MDPLTIDVIKIFTLGVLAFLTAFLSAPILINFLYKYKFWKKEVKVKAIDGRELPVFQKFHSENETKIPRGGGVLFWLITLILIFLFFFISEISNIWWLDKLNFLSREQTWLPLFALIIASLIGLFDDILTIRGKGKYVGGGFSLKTRLLLMALIGLIGGYWFHFRLGWETLHIPGVGPVEIGILYIPLFILIMLAVYSGGVIDGLDGLAAGTFASIFTAFALIALWRDQIDLAAFCFVLVGTLLAFLWFNIPPAKFYMGETGSMGLTAALTVIVFFTDSVLILPIIGILLVVWSGSVIIQLISKKFLKKKFFSAAPLHLHLQERGWTHYQITMRMWLIGTVAAVIGTAIKLLG
jgi:phospho-N-acetylmuramoyl-pentapeptide-transferase